MKNLLLIAVATLLALPAFSQNLPIPTKWKIKKIGVHFGHDEDMISGINYQYMIQTGKNVDQSVFSSIPFKDQDMYSGVCENPQIRITATLGVPGLKNTELNLALTSVTGRFDGVYYSTYNYEDWLNGDYNSDYVSVNTLTDELGLEGSFVKRMHFWKFVNFYAGAGTNIGYSYNGKMTIEGHSENTVNQNLNRTNSDISSGNTYYEQIYEEYEAKDVFHQRAFAQLGLGFIIFKRVELVLDYRGGVGYRAIADVPVKMTRLNSVSLGARWILR